MPITPLNKSRYPGNWASISKRIRFERAQGKCECTGECGYDHKGRCNAAHDELHPVTGSRVILTTAHLDHTPENCADDNLRAMCQRCHNSYDRAHRNTNRSITRINRLRDIHRECGQTELILRRAFNGVRQSRLVKLLSKSAPSISKKINGTRGWTLDELHKSMGFLGLHFMMPDELKVSEEEFRALKTMAALAHAPQRGIPNELREEYDALRCLARKSLECDGE